MNHEPGLSYELYTKLDASGDSTITQDEVELLVQRLGHQLNLRTLAQRGINSILRKLDIIMLILVIAIILIIFFELFLPTDATNFRTFITSIGLFGLALSHPLLEFVNNCIFVFGKHTYDVGDFVEAKKMQLLVTHIGLTHTNFEEVEKYNSSDRGLVVQMNNLSLANEPIKNWTRTAEIALQKKEEDMAKDKEKKKEEKESVKEVRKLILLQSAKLKSEGIEIEDKDKGDKKDKDKGEKKEKEGKEGEKKDMDDKEDGDREIKEGEEKPKEGDKEKKEKGEKDGSNKDKKDEKGDGIGISMKNKKDKDDEKGKDKDKDESGKQGGGGGGSGAGGGGGSNNHESTQRSRGNHNGKDGDDGPAAAGGVEAANDNDDDNEEQEDNQVDKHELFY